MKSIEFGCSKCDRMFNTLIEMEAHMKEHTKQQPPITPNTVLSNPEVDIIKGHEVGQLIEKKRQIPSESATLTYLYKGMCSCGGSLMTLEIDVEALKGAGKHFVVAICSVCKKQVKTREVAKL